MALLVDMMAESQFGRALDELRRRLIGEQPYPAGSWFQIDNSTTAFALNKPGHHRWVLLSEWGGGPTAQAMPRTSSGSGMTHNAHPKGHEPGCTIDRDGCIVLQRHSLDGDWLDRYLCTEPDQSITDRLKGFTP